jgi:hypothetical protein
LSAANELERNPRRNESDFEVIEEPSQETMIDKALY